MDNELLKKIVENQEMTLKKLEELNTRSVETSNYIKDRLNYENHLENLMEAIDDRTKKLDESLKAKLNYENHLENLMEAVDNRTKQILDLLNK